jgi:plastocyanin
VEAMTWRRLLRWSAIAGIVEYVIVMATSKSVIPPLIIIGLVLVVGVVLLGRPGRAGLNVTLVGFVIFLLSNLLFSASSLAAPRSFPSWALVFIATITGIIGLTAAIAARPDRPESATPAKIIRGAVALSVVATLANVGASVTYKNATHQAGDVVVTAKDTKFVQRTLTASAGQVRFYLKNQDLQLHNFHIKGASAVMLPASHSAEHTFNLPRGTYSYVCDFHSDMRGTLTVN